MCRKEESEDVCSKRSHFIATVREDDISTGSKYGNPKLFFADKYTTKTDNIRNIPYKKEEQSIYQKKQQS